MDDKLLELCVCVCSFLQRFPQEISGTEVMIFVCPTVCITHSNSIHTKKRNRCDYCTQLIWQRHVVFAFCEKG